MRDKRVIVFGAAGFIGTYLIEELMSAGYQVSASDWSEIGAEYYSQLKIPYYKVDIRDKKQFWRIRGNYDFVIHLAALQPANFSSKVFSRADYIEINVNGTMNILEFALARKARKIIYASSHRNTSGLWNQKRLIYESDGRALEYKGEYSMFSLSESAAQDCVSYFNCNTSLRGIIFRLPPVYGYGPHLEIFKEGRQIKTGFQTFIEQAKAGKPIEIWGNSRIGRDVIYVKDVTRAFLLAMRSNKAEGLFNISTGYKLTLEEEVKTIVQVFWPPKSRPILIRRPEKPHTMDSFAYSNARAAKILGWKPLYNFRDLLLDYEKELKRNKFEFLIRKRKKQFKTAKING